MRDRIKLFRSEATSSFRHNEFGSIVLISPLSFIRMAVFSLASAIAVLTFFIFGIYTKHTSVQGELIPRSGLAKVYPLQPGILIQKNISDGQYVKKGDVLFVLSSDRASSIQRNVQEAISSTVSDRKRSLETELTETRTIQLEERAALTRKISSLEAELFQLDGQIANQKNRTSFSQESVSRYEGLLSKGYISREQLQQRQEEMIEQRLRVQGLERDRITIVQNLNEEKNSLNTLRLRQQSKLAPLQRSISSAVQDLNESEGKRQVVLTAPAEGTATAVLGEQGQMVDGNHPLVSIVPLDAVLEAHLYVPSRAIGFIKAGDHVLLRYQSYPYQKFGHGDGRVLSVSRTTLSPNELSNFISTPTHVSSESLYLVKVDIKSQTIKAYGKNEPLQAGMLIDADVLQETRHLYEWVLEPLYSVTGKLF